MPFAAPGQTIITMGGRRVVVGSPAAAVPTYAEFQAHIATLAVNGSVAGSYVYNDLPEGTARRFVVTGLASSGAMFGSSWIAAFGGGALSRVIQHGLPNEATFTDQVSNGREVYVSLTANADYPAFSAVNRNGYTSVPRGAALDEACSCVSLIYWTPGGVFQMNPSTGTGPTPYTW